MKEHPILFSSAMVRAILSVAQMIGGGDVTERRVFARLWCATYGASSWERNEWVWALTFERCADPSPRAGKVAP